MTHFEILYLKAIFGGEKKEKEIRDYCNKNINAIRTEFKKLFHTRSTYKMGKIFKLKDLSLWSTTRFIRFKTQAEWLINDLTEKEVEISFHDANVHEFFNTIFKYNRPVRIATINIIDLETGEIRQRNYDSKFQPIIN